MYHIYILKMSNIIPVLALIIVTLIQDILYYTDYDIDSKYYNTDDNLKKMVTKEGQSISMETEKRSVSNVEHNHSLQTQTNITCS